MVRVAASSPMPLAATGRSRAKAPSSGMQTFSQTSQVARAEMAKRSPGLASRGTVISTGRTTVPSKPKLTSGSTRMAFGTGQAMGPASAPGGKVQSIRVGSPESPGFCQ